MRRIVVVMVLGSLAAAVTGCGGRSTAPTSTVTVTSPAETVTVSQPRRYKPSASPTPPAPALPASLTTYAGSYFSIAHSSAWYVESGDVKHGSDPAPYFDTTIENARNPKVLIRVDVTPNAFTPDPVQSARTLEVGLRGQPEYRRLDFRY